MGIDNSIKRVEYGIACLIIRKTSISNLGGIKKCGYSIVAQEQRVSYSDSY